MTATVASAAKRITRKLLLASSIALVAWSGCTPYISTSSVEFKSLSEEIRQRVQRLEYPESVAQDFADMTLAWKDTRGRPLVVVCKRRLDEATQHHQQGRISKGNLAQVQQAIARDLSHKIRAELRSGEGVFDLADVVKRRECNCVGRMQTLYILGTTVGDYQSGTGS